MSSEIKLISPQLFQIGDQFLHRRTRLTQNEEPPCEATKVCEQVLLKSHHHQHHWLLITMITIHTHSAKYSEKWVRRIICVVNRPAVAISSNSSTVFQQFQHVQTVLYQARTGEEQKGVNWNGRELWRPLCKILIICENHIFSIFPCIICAFVIRSNSSQFSPSPLVTKGYFFQCRNVKFWLKSLLPFIISSPQSVELFPQTTSTI